MGSYHLSWYDPVCSANGYKMNFKDIIVRRSKSIGWIEINRIEVNNAARPKTMEEICKALDELEGDDQVRAVVITGRGKHFMAGGDFEFLKNIVGTRTEDVRDQLYEHFQGVTRRLFQFPKPTIAAVAGAAITVGCEIALACDIRIAANTAKFEESWIKIGLMPPLGGAMLLPRFIGLGLAKEMILEGKSLDAQEALDAGLVNIVVEQDQLHDTAEARALSMAALPRHAFRTSKEAIHRGIESTMEIEWAANVMAQSILLGTEDFRTRLQQLLTRQSNS